MKVEEFVFTKKDGSIRSIIGTRSFKDLEQTEPLFIKPQGIRKSSPTVTTFWDMEAQHFKSYITDNLISKRTVSFDPMIKTKIWDTDFFFNGSYADEPTKIKKGKTPYFVLSILNAFNGRTQAQLVESLAYISTKINISKNPQRTSGRVLKAFVNNSLVNLSDGKYYLTVKGFDFLAHNVK